MSVADHFALPLLISAFSLIFGSGVLDLEILLCVPSRTCHAQRCEGPLHLVYRRKPKIGILRFAQNIRTDVRFAGVQTRQ